ncbi:MAG: GntR family transcriptional regulator [Chloroflexi bacterium]|nr:GntR family transcriptional regulator [Chloroflexota bacterium]
MPRSTRGSQAFVPHYVQIRDEIGRRIASGELQKGDRIPSLREMCTEFGVSSITARRALLDLLNEGIVERRGGLGAFVTGLKRRARIAIVIIGYSEGSWRENSGSFGQLVGGIASATWEQDALLSVLPINDPTNAPEALRQLLHDHPVDGLLLRVAGDVDWRVVDIPTELSVSTVLIKRTPPVSGVPAVLPDARRAGELAVDHLVGLGHRRIGLITATAATDTYRDHKAGFIAALQRHGIRIGRELVSEVPSVFGEHRRAAAERLLSLPERPTALVTNADFLALGAYEVAAAHGLVIPDDLSVVSFDDMEFAQHLNPPLTTVRLSYYDLGRVAATTLFRVLDDEEVPTVQQLPVDLVIRESTAAPKLP